MSFEILSNFTVCGSISKCITSFIFKKTNNGHITYADGLNFAKNHQFLWRKKQSIDLQEHAHKSLEKTALI